jgi:hypothetical protein
MIHDKIVSIRDVIKHSNNWEISVSDYYVGSLNFVLAKNQQKWKYVIAILMITLTLIAERMMNGKQKFRNQSRIVSGR